MVCARRASASPSLFLIVLALPGCFGSSASSPDASAAFDGGFDGPVAFDSAAEGAASDAAVDSPSDASGEAGTEAGGGDASVLYDAGSGCVPTGSQAGLSPSAEGLPATGLALWLRADRGLYTRSADGGSTVCGWGDVAGNGHLLTVGGSVAPTASASGVGGQAGVEFAGNGAYLTTSSVLGLGATAARTFVAVVTTVAPDARFEPIAQGIFGSAGTYLGIDANPWQTSGTKFGVYVTSSAFETATAPVASKASLHVLSIPTMTTGAMIAPVITYRIDGVAQTFTLLGGGGNGAFQDFTGANFTGVGAMFLSSTGVPADTLVGEVLVYDHALSTADVTAVETSLKARYAIP